MGNLHTSIAVASICLTSAFLGCVFGLGFFVWIIYGYSIGGFFAFLSLFHLLEFYITARFQGSQLSWDSFILNNGKAYWLAMLVGLLECLLSGGKSFAKVINCLRFPSFLINFIFSVYQTSALGFLCLGQYLRSSAMVQAGQSFSHIVASKRNKDHLLVTDGIYAYVRHPSYVGFFIWALGTQMLLGNFVSTLLFSLVLWKFFSQRITTEEAYLVSFFGDSYEQYRKKVPSGIPLIP
ncbi:protein-S isoprenylcysteine O-methyltransferase Mam4 [Schizosaccharomyces pombe]|uniref:Protein-S-isoprenylcysteine O-methyltransferase n=1 Tax=Schizosaccharomyces pombe (strain 972 / ATCC 24843) TaxID=284812 RepID=MAM4_SCHPO|nr:protein-S isoprenylcysteine O-methyltransferase Mam4 [Schizosaccharomyces pombe]P87014.1 RecName: Full=Protein-S-isoprenylcysteine O-methyltransferase; AltName: Full=Isoprenylcysteine carboxylmethyltransferase; AltName: Full=Prenylated protein carboxyl methyltransferase; Short=PPMT; AltName: Full=Prenylcysteine carboxyl methyltransferase; Short=pcCMT [Schizosaccharomyces pombe 972h-]BAA18999.1 farnesyl cysteine carboxyl methyltransferase [Schizosaccharomyces pombe]CAA15725.1 protein-S isopren|eukprot:NP_593263.1 protein-S isoprenylcysteine O-methyltransferase Mam4 [Schizosaccharomyces pombe]